MSAGFPPKYSANFPFIELTPEQFLVLAVETAGRLGWAVQFISKTGFIADAGKVFGAPTSEFRARIIGNSAELSGISRDGLIDLGRNKKNILKFTEEFEKVKAVRPAGELEEKYAALSINFPVEEEDVLLHPKGKERFRPTDLLSFFKPVRGFFVTPLLIDLNILIFILMAFTGVSIMDPSTDDLVLWGANFRPVTLDGEWWRLVTCVFLHIGIVHLLMNMYALVYIGLFLEPLMGSGRFFAAYLLTGIAASVTSLWWNDLVVSAGASGAIFGMYGVFLAMLTTNLVEKSFRKAILASIILFVIYNLAYGLKGGIDNAAHIGGLLSGIIMGYAFYPSLKKPDQARPGFITAGILAIVVLGASYMVYRNTPNVIKNYDARMEEFARMETMAMGLYNLPETSSDEEVLQEINTRGIYYWKECIRLMDELDQWDLPEMLRERDHRIRAYCDLRLKSYELIASSIEEDTHAYDGRIDSCMQAIQGIIEQLNGAGQ